MIAVVEADKRNLLGAPRQRSPTRSPPRGGPYG